MVREPSYPLMFKGVIRVLLHEEDRHTVPLVEFLLNLPAVAKAGAKASVAARIMKADNRASDLLPIIEELKAAGCLSPADRRRVE